MFRERKNILVIILLLVCNFALSQDLQADFTNIIKKYASIKNFSALAEIKVFQDYSSLIANETQKLFYIQNGTYFYYRLGEQEMIKNATCFLIIDNHNKVIIIDSAKKQSHFKNYDYLGYLKNIDSLLSPFKKAEYYKINETESGYKIKTGTNNIPEIGIYYNNKTYIIEKVILYMDISGTERGNVPAGKPRVEITYQKFDSGYLYNPDDFNIFKYVRYEKGNFYPRPSYFQYKVYNQMIE